MLTPLHAHIHMIRTGAHDTLSRARTYAYPLLWLQTHIHSTRLQSLVAISPATGRTLTLAAVHTTHTTPRYRDQVLGRSEEDRPLVLQLGGSDPAVLTAAAVAAIADGRCDAVELNCGCPQRCARQGGYGAFLLDSAGRTRLVALISALRAALPPDVPVLAKMRVLHDPQETAAVAREMVAAGVGVLTVHGRTRRQGGGTRQGSRGSGGDRLASWPHIAAVKRAVPVAVVANGNVRNAADAVEALAATGCDAVMSGCGLLRNPALFSTLFTRGLSVTAVAHGDGASVAACATSTRALVYRKDPVDGAYNEVSPAHVVLHTTSDPLTLLKCGMSAPPPPGCGLRKGSPLLDADDGVSSDGRRECAGSDAGCDDVGGSGGHNERRNEFDVEWDADVVNQGDVEWHAGVCIACQYLDLAALHGAYPSQVSPLLHHTRAFYSFCDVAQST
jgi:tRNA-dihydrouridine synthase